MEQYDRNFKVQQLMGVDTRQLAQGNSIVVNSNKKPAGGKR